MNQVLEAKKIQCMADVEIGHILSASWGYDQTNIDYYVVIRKMASMVELQAIGQKYVESASSMSEYVMPDPNAKLYDYFWVKPGDARDAQKLAKEKNWEIDPEQSGPLPWKWSDDYSRQEIIEGAVKYRKTQISKHKVSFDNNSGICVRMSSYKYAYSWDGKKDFQSHWA